MEGDYCGVDKMMVMLEVGGFDRFLGGRIGRFWWLFGFGRGCEE